jgi:two-component sensor histidine kinase
LVSNTILRRFVGDRIPSLDPENKWHWNAWGEGGRLLKESQWPSVRALRGEHVTPGLDFLYTFDDGKEIWVRVSSVPFRNEAGESKGVISIVQDTDEQKRAEEALEKIEEIRIKEIHHRIKNNLQVISSLLDLQAEKFSGSEVCKVPEVLEAFMESQSRVISMALIHEELYKGDNIDTLDFSAYLKKLASDLFSSYNLGDKDISLKLNLDQIYLGMDTAIPLGIIVNELVSNSFKHAFPDRRRQGEIQISLCRTEAAIAENEISSPDKDSLQKHGFEYILTVADNGKGIPEEIDFQNSGSLGLQLVNILVEQIDGCMELKMGNGTEFTIWFNNIES